MITNQPISQNHIYYSNIIKKVKKQFVQNLGIAEYNFIQNIGLNTYKIIRKLYPKSSNWLILCGNSDNTVYGYIIALLGLQAGIKITLLSYSDYDSSILLSKQLIYFRQKWIQSGGVIHGPKMIWPKNINIIIDSMLGLNVKPPSFFCSLLIKKVNKCRLIPVVSIDIPSGLSSHTGTVLGAEAIKANYTIILGMLNVGQLIGQARDYVGKLYYLDIGLRSFLNNKKSRMIRYDTCHLPYWLTKRKLTSHKGDFGRLLVIGGNLGMAGAVRMTAEAALRTGSGVVKVITHKKNVEIVSYGRPELIVHEYSYKNFLKQLDWANVIVVGPGLGDNAWSYEIFNNIINIKKPTLWDADALKILALYPNINIHKNRVLTPHPGEAAQLLGITVSSVEKNRIAAVKNLVKYYGGVIVLKGACTLIANKKGNIAFADVGDSSLSSAGMGDVLSGIIASLIGQKLSIFNAACAGCIVHGAAGQNLSLQRGQRGILATDLINNIWKFINPI